MDPEAVTRRLYDALAAGDLEAYRALIAEDVVFHVDGTSIVAGTHRGIDAVVRLGTLVLGETGGTFRTDLRSVLANDSHAVVLHHWTAERRGRRIAMDNVNVYRFENGLVAERWEVIADQEEHDAFWAG
ncbi:nuclear transport factor 2 family protein [Nonomuraea typhae]|uniref:nuclear transport factor 2 family protein n=1 Tax=Nonomuraea typhae TaxID=2603600 RepID=UPI0012FC2EF2|nr:nuclear transport factor 2 family protein [Nonomuraea typhae]